MTIRETSKDFFIHAIRNKLLLAMTVPAGLLVAQIVSVHYFISQLQEATTFISSAHGAIEADFGAAGLVAKLREEVKQLPSIFVRSKPRPRGTLHAYGTHGTS